MRSRTAAALVCGLALAAAACSSVPTSGTATVVGPAPTAAAVDDSALAVRREGAPPLPDAAPGDIVDGFLDAEADTTPDGAAVAQQYLAPSTDWVTEGETLVYTGKELDVGPLTAAGSHDVTVSYSLLARISADGEYRPDVSRYTQTFTVLKRPDGWRILSLPRGRRINQRDLAQVFRRAVPYFYSSRDYDTLVPDPVFVDRLQPQIKTLVERVLEGPTPVLSDFLPPSLFPAGTKLLTASEPDNSVTELTFSKELNEARAVDKPKIVAQLVWTLTAMDSRIAVVRIKAADQVFTFEDPSAEVTDEQRQVQWTAFDPDTLYARRTSFFNLNGTLGRYRPSGVIHAGRLLGAGSGQPAVSPDGTSVAVTAPVGALQELRLGPTLSGQPLVSQLKSERLTKPSWGTKSDGALVVAQEGDEAPVVRSVTGDRDNRTVESPELTGRVHAFEVAPDGLRVAAIIERGGVRSLEIGYITRFFAGAARRVSGFRPVVNGANVSASSVAWVDSGKLAFIGRRGEERPQVFTVLVDGTSLEDNELSGDVLALNEPSPAQQPQLLALAVSHETARRADSSTPTDLMLVINGNVPFTSGGVVWSRLPNEPRTNIPK